MLPKTTAPDLYNSYCKWQPALTASLHTALSPEVLSSDSQAAKIRAEASTTWGGRIVHRAVQYGFAAASGSSYVASLPDCVVGTGRDRKAYIVGPDLAQSAANHLKTSVRHFSDTGLFGLSSGLQLGAVAAVGAAAGVVVGLAVSGVDYAISRGAHVGGEEMRSRCNRFVSEWAGLGAIVGSGVGFCTGGAQLSIALGCMRVLTALLKALMTGSAFIAGAAVGVVKETSVAMVTHMPPPMVQGLRGQALGA